MNCVQRPCESSPDVAAMAVVLLEKASNCARLEEQRGIYIHNILPF